MTALSCLKKYKMTLATLVLSGVLGNVGFNSIDKSIDVLKEDPRVMKTINLETDLKLRAERGYVLDTKENLERYQIDLKKYDELNTPEIREKVSRYDSYETRGIAYTFGFIGSGIASFGFLSYEINKGRKSKGEDE